MATPQNSTDHQRERITVASLLGELTSPNSNSPDTLKITVGLNKKGSDRVTTFHIPAHRFNKACKQWLQIPECKKARERGKPLRITTVRTKTFEVFALWLFRDRFRDNMEEYMGYVLNECENAYPELFLLSKAFLSREFKNWLMNFAYHGFCHSQTGDFMWALKGLTQMQDAGLEGELPHQFMLESLAYRILASQASWEPGHLVTKPHPQRSCWQTPEEQLLFGSLTKKDPLLILEIGERIDRMSKDLKNGRELVNPGEVLCSEWHIHESEQHEKQCSQYREP